MSWLFESYGTADDISIYQTMPLITSGAKFMGIVQNNHKRICKVFCREAAKIECCEDLEPFNLDLFGWSRGAVAAMTLAKMLKDEGCTCTVTRRCGFVTTKDDLIIKPITVRFIGLIDPVTLGLGFVDYATAVPSNVQRVFWAVADEWSVFQIGQVLPPPGLQTVKHYGTTHQQSGFRTTLTIGIDTRSAAEAAGVKFAVIGVD